MKERLLQLLDLEQITPSKFADIIGVQRSSVSHVISGRNNPSYDFLHKTLKAFPGLNASWLMLGEGTMYEQMGRKVTESLFDTPEELSEEGILSNNTDKDVGTEQISPSQEPSDGSPEETQLPESPVDTEPNKQFLSPSEKPPKKVVQVMMFYEDDTFRTYTPEQ